MKKKTGFTLAEVLITLAIIGIIAALVLPALLNNFQFRAVGTRLSKFMSTVENNARAYVEVNGSLDPGYVAAQAAQGNQPAVAGSFNLDNYINDSFSMTDIAAGSFVLNNRRNMYQMPQGNRAAAGDPAGQLPAAFTNAITNTTVANGNNPAPVTLKDGTRANFFALNVSDQVWPQGLTLPDQGQIGRPALGIVYDPSANALPASVRRIFGFVVTELGYVFPAPTDGCTWTLFNARWQTTPAQFAADTACGAAGALGAVPVQNGN